MRYLIFILIGIIFFLIGNYFGKHRIIGGIKGYYPKIGIKYEENPDIYCFYSFFGPENGKAVKGEGFVSATSSVESIYFTSLFNTISIKESEKHCLYKIRPLLIFTELRDDKEYIEYLDKMAVEYRRQ